MLVKHGKILSKNKVDPDLLKKVITVNKSWAYGYDIETKVQSSRFATIEEIIKIETGTMGDNKKRVLELFRGLGKTPA